MYNNNVNYTGYASYNHTAYSQVKSQDNETKAEKEKAEAEKVAKEQGMTEVKGPGTYGNPKLSEKAMKYYEKLKKKFGNLDFVLVAADKKQEAEAMKGSIKTPRGMVVLIDTDKIEKMAEDEEYRKQYEGIISSASAKMIQMKNELTNSGKKVSSFGMSFDKSGMPSYFAVIDKSLVQQKERIETKRKEKAQTRKEEAKKAAKEQRENRAEERKKAGKADKEESYFQKPSPDQTTVTANSWEGLLDKIDEVLMSELSDKAVTQEELKVGQSIDYSA